MDSIGNYEIIKVISEKSSSRVCLGIHKKLKRKTLLKIYFGADDNLIQRFEREAQIVAELDHESIVSVYDFGEEDGKYYISMEYVEGYNLKEYLQNRKLSDDEIIDFAYQISKSISILHEKGYIHRDLKPENILISLQRQVKITDFGITLHEGINRMTREGDLVGTPLYMSPEQVNNLPLSFASDVFSLGIIFYQMATGVHPFQAQNFGEIFSKILSHHPVSVREIRPTLPGWFSEMISKMLAKDSRDRYQDTQEITREMSSHYEKSQKNPDDKREIKTPVIDKRKRILYYTAFIIPVLLIIAFGLTEWKHNGQKGSKPDEPNNAQVAFADSLKEKVFPDEPEDKKSLQNINQSIITDPVKNFEDKLTEKDSAGMPVSSKISGETTILVNTWPWAKIYLNYSLLDTVPMTLPRKIKPGKYLLTLRNPNYPLWSDSITVQPNQKNVFTYNFDEIFYQLILKVDPWGDVYIDGEYIGQTPFADPIYLPCKNHILEIRNEYYKVWKDTLVWRGEKRIEKFITLEEIPISHKRD